MGQKQSKEELIYQHLIEGNINAIKALCNEGVRLEWMDKEGKTPLIVACMDPRLYIETKTLIELGANLDAYRPGSHAGTPLHHAAKRGLDRTVKLLLAHGANPFIRNDDCQTPLDVARTKGYCNVVRVIEDHICYFSGDIREVLVVPGLFDSLVPHRIARKSSKKSWVAVVPCDPPNKRKPSKLELVVYPSSQDPQPRTVIPLWKSDILEPKFHESDPSLTIIYESKTRFKFLSAVEGDRRQLAQLYNACKGVPKVMPSSEHMPSIGISPSQPESNTISRPESSSGSNSQSSSTTNGWGDTDSKSNHNGWGPPSDALPPSKTTFNGWADNPTTEECNGWGANPGPSRPIVSPTVPVHLTPSAPPLPMEGVVDDGLVNYPAIDVGLVDLPDTSIKANDNPNGSCCVICWEAPIEGACVPCGHMAGCMSCLSDIKSNKGVCPVCRAKIDQVIRIYAV